MSAKDYRRSDRKIIRSRLGGAVKELDAYIYSEEKRFGVIIVEGDKISKCQPEIIESFDDLKSALKRDRADKEEAYEYLKKSNKTMKKMLEKLQEEMKLCRENINNEFTNFDNLNTDRLLSINPNRFTMAGCYSDREKRN